MRSILHMPGHLLRRLHQISASVFAAGMKEAGSDLTSPQFAALAMLEARPGVDQATLAGLIALDRPTMGGVIERLAAKGMVRREINPRDRRARMLSLTAEGTATVHRLAPIVEALQADILAGLGAEERREFLRLAEKVVDAGGDRTDGDRARAVKDS